jgi:signal transduction histidine kinase
MKKVAVVFVLAVLVPSLVLAWLAARSLRYQQLESERQQTLLCQAEADRLARAVAGAIAERQREFAQYVESLLAGHSAREVAPGFDERLRQSWPVAEVGFVVSLDGDLLAPSVFGCVEARQFRVENERFLTSRETVEVIWNGPKGAINLSQLDRQKEETRAAESKADPPLAYLKDPDGKSVFATKAGKIAPGTPAPTNAAAGKVAEFRQMIGDSYEGTLARFLQNQLKLVFWYRPARDPALVFGTQVKLEEITAGLRPLVRVDTTLATDLAVALLDDNGKAVATWPPEFKGTGARPYVAAAVGEVLPHWEISAWLTNPARLGRAAQTLRFTLGLSIAVLVLAIVVGSWLIGADISRQLRLARQKTDFVSNVSHELQTPLTSIRMFAEMLAEGRVPDPARQRSFLGVITSEAARLTRLINNVLDFSRMEQGRKKYQLAPCDLAALVRETAASYRPHLEEAGFKLATELPDRPVELPAADHDALAQVLLNLISNAEKYSGDSREITLQLATENRPAASAEVRVLDRGLGVPAGAEEQIFEQFFRAHDSLSSGIQGAGLGLTLARQIARAHGGDVFYRPRPGGGSCFALRLPLATNGLPPRSRPPTSPDTRS